MPIYGRKISRGLRYFFKFDYLGVTYRSKAIYLTRADAKKAEAEKLIELENLSSAKDLKLVDLMDSRLDRLETKSREYYRQNKRCYKKFLAFVGREIMAGEVTKQQLNSFLLREAASYRREGHTNAVVNQQIRLLKALWGHYARVFDGRNITHNLEMFPVEKTIKRIPTDSEIDAVLDRCNDRQRFLLDFIMETGARINEALALRGRDIGEEFVVLYTRKSKHSNLVPRKVPVTHDFFRGLTFGPEQRIFPDWGESVDYRPHFLGRIVKDLGQLPWNFHHLRHRYASRLVMENVPLTIVQERLGHMSLVTTTIYLQSLPIVPKSSPKPHAPVAQADRARDS